MRPQRSPIAVRHSNWLRERMARRFTTHHVQKCPPPAAAVAALALVVVDATLWGLHRYKRVQYIDCGEAFLVSAPEGGRSIDRRIMPDGVHPNAAGMDTLGLCLDPTVAFLKSNPNAGEVEQFVDEVRGTLGSTVRPLHTVAQGLDYYLTICGIMRW